MGWIADTKPIKDGAYTFGTASLGSGQKVHGALKAGRVRGKWEKVSCRRFFEFMMVKHFIDGETLCE